MSIRDDRAAAVRRYYRDLTDDLERRLPAFLDALEAVDAKHPVHALVTVEGTPSDEAITAWIRTHEREFEALVRKWDRIAGNGDLQRVTVDPKPLTRRRTARKDGG